MNIFKKFFHKHELEDVSCPYTMKTYTMCVKCGQKMGWRLTNG
jgi:hypothetical protein